MSGITSKLADWNTDSNYVGQAMDSAMYASAHADDTLVLVGPPRFNGDIQSLKAVGVLQNFQVSQGRQIVPHQAIGSARTFFQCSKASVNGSLGRLFVNGNNLFRALYNNMFNAQQKYALDGVGTKNSELLPFAEGQENYMVNLDSRMFLIPFGLAVVFNDKLQNSIGGIYIELCVIPNWSAGISAGSPTLVEGTSFMADRVVAFNPSTGIPEHDQAKTANAKFNEILAAGDVSLKARLDSILSK